jgi:hypothetical protein
LAAPACGGLGALADAALRIVHEHWLGAGQPVRATRVAHLGHLAECRDPRIAESYAASFARGGRDADLRAASEVCH